MDLDNNFVITDTDQSTYKCTGVLPNFLHCTQTLAIGQCLTSQIFEMKCPKIGKSRWTLIVFPAGQYEYEKDNGKLSVYLKMVGCEYENEKLLVDVKFFIDTEEKFSKVVLATFQYENKRSRWVGTSLASKLEFNTPPACKQLMRDNNLVIGCRMIHSTIVSDEANDIELKERRLLAIQNECANPSEINVPSLHSSSLSTIHSQNNGAKSSRKNSTETVPSTIISENKRSVKRKVKRYILCC